MSVNPDYPDYSPHVAAANQIAATGVPLLNLHNLLANDPVFNIGPTLFGGPAAVQFTQPGYEIRVSLTCPAATAVPFAQVTLIWTDFATGFPLGKDSYIVPCATTIGNWVAYGQGPTKGNQVQVRVGNLDAAATITAGVAIFQNSRVYENDDWWYSNSDNALLAVNGYTIPVLPQDDTVLGMEGGLVVNASSSSASYLCGLHDGLIGVGVNMNAGLLSSIVIEISPQPTSYYVPNNPLFAATPPGSAFTVAGVRAPLRVIIVNQATTPVTLTWSLVRIPS